MEEDFGSSTLSLYSFSFGVHWLAKDLVESRASTFTWFLAWDCLVAMRILSLNSGETWSPMMDSMSGIQLPKESVLWIQVEQVPLPDREKGSFVCLGESLIYCEVVI